MVRLAEDEDAAQHVDHRRLPTDWKAVIAAAGLFGSFLYFAGVQFRDLLRPDMAVAL